MMFRLFVCLLGTGATLLAVDATAPIGLKGSLPRIDPTPAEQTAKSFQVLDGFRMELLAAEPIITDPVAMAYDEDGRAYVVEMNDYPYTDKARHKPGQENPTDQPIGKVRLLVDTDGDGKFDQATVFADGLSWPTGVACWRGGVFVAATPDVWYFKDTDGDGKADVRQKLFTGFRKLNVQAVMNNLIWGLDHQIYGAGSSNGGQVRRMDLPEFKPVDVTRRDFRFDPRTQELEAISGGARFGNSFDDWGNRFLCNIRNPAQHVVVENRYLARNPHVAARSPLQDVAEAGDQLPVYRTSPPEAWRVLRAEKWAADPSQTMPRSELVGAGVVTSSSGITVYRGAAYPPQYYGQIFVCDVAGNLFYRLKTEPDGPTFKATRADEKVDFVTSTDIWFRPVNFINAPDGCLHVLDMYREVIEHPWSIPDDLHAALDLERGRDKGRLYRLAPPNFRAPSPPRFSRATTAELVATLENPNSWWRETAHRLLFERQDKAAMEPLRRLLQQSTKATARLHALYSLAGLEALTNDDLVRALNDSEAGLREHGIRLVEPRLKQLASDSPLPTRLFALAGDASPRVRFQLALTLGELTDARATASLATIAARDAADPWMRTAVLSSSASAASQLLTNLLTQIAFAENPDNHELLRSLAQTIGASNQPAELRNLFAAWPANPALQRTLLIGLGDGSKRLGKPVRTVVKEASPSTAATVDALFAAQRTAAGDAKAEVVTRVQAVQLLALDEFENVRAGLVALLQPQQPQEVQRAALAALGSFNRPEVAGLLLDPWRTFTPALRGEVIQSLLGYKNRLLPLFDAIEAGKVAASQIPPARRALLLKHADGEIRSRATKLLAGESASPRKEVIAKYQPALNLKGDAIPGQRLYEMVCQACHRLGNQGNDVGPNLATIRQWTADQLLVNILDPNREVAPTFVEYVAELKDGETVSGVIAGESATSMTLKRADGTAQTILRSNLAQMTSSGMSLMPEGLESAITPQQMADLIAFLTGPVK